MSNDRHRIDFRLALIAALALIVAQFGALAHAYTHAPKLSAISGQMPAPTDHPVCGECLNFAPLLTAAGAAAPALYVKPPARGPQSRMPPAALPVPQPLLAFRSRAPPAAR